MKKSLFAALVLIAVAAPARAQLPDAKSLITKYNAATGADAFMKLTSLRETGTFELPAAGISASIEIIRKAPNKNVVHVSIPGMGEVVRGFDGTVGYSMNPMQGDQVLSGAQLQAAAEEAQFGSTIRAPEFFTSQETVEKTNAGGVDCYKVKLVWKSGRTSFDCYAVDSGLLVGSWISQETPQGTFDVAITMGDYKKFGDITVPTKVTQSIMGQEQTIAISNVEFNKVDDAAFVLPATIQALLPKK